MNPQRVTLDLEDGDGVETFPVFNALRGLAAIHMLPKVQRIHYIRRHDGRTLVFVQVAATDGDAWRAALAAPPFEPSQQPLGIQYLTEVFWFGATVRLCYSVGPVAVNHG